MMIGNRTPLSAVLVLAFFLCGAGSPVQGEMDYGQLQEEELGRMWEAGQGFANRWAATPPSFLAEDAARGEFNLGSWGKYDVWKEEWEPKTYTMPDVYKLRGDLHAFGFQIFGAVNRVLSHGGNRLWQLLGDDAGSRKTTYSIVDDLVSDEEIARIREHNRLLHIKAAAELGKAKHPVQLEQGTTKGKGGKTGDSRAPDSVRHGSDSAVVVTDRKGLTAKPDSTLPPWEKWRRLNAAMDSYESDKNAPGERVENMFNSEHEKMAYDNLLETIDRDIESDSRKIEEKQVELSQLRGRIRDLDDKIAQARNNMADLKKRKQELKAIIDKKRSSPGDVRREKEQIPTEIMRINESIAAEQAQVTTYQTRRSSASDGLASVLGVFDLAGSALSIGSMLSPSAYSARSNAYDNTASYAASSNAGGGGNGGHGWDKWIKEHQAQIKGYGCGSFAFSI